MRVVALLVCLICYAYGLLEENNILDYKDGSTSVYAGFTSAFDSSVPNQFSTTSQNNFARSGSGVAFAGNNVTVSAPIDAGTFNWQQYASNNKAVTWDAPASAGTSLNIETSNINAPTYITGEASGNVARVVDKGSSDNPEENAFAGVYTNIDSRLGLDDVLNLNVEATNNIARNKDFDSDKEQANAFSGTDSSLASAYYGQISIDSTTENNKATSRSGDAMAGVYNSFPLFIGTDLNSSSSAKYNKAVGEDRAVSGVLETFGYVLSESDLVVDQVAVGNLAESRGGANAVSGTVFDAQNIDLSDVDINAVAINNTAIASTQDINNEIGAVAGVRVIGQLSFGSNIDIDADSHNNTARSDGLAVAGTDVTILNSFQDDITVKANSTNNFAESVNGPAIAGNRIYSNYGPESNVNFDLYARNNQAFSQNGNAVVDNEIDVAAPTTVINTTGITG